jgi:hypothetical protein
MVKAFTQKTNVAILVKDSRKKQPTDVDTSMPREKVGTHVRSLARKHDLLLIKRGRKGHVSISMLLH